MRSVSYWVTGAAVLSLVLAACTQAASTATPTLSPTDTPTATPPPSVQPTSTPTPTDPTATPTTRPTPTPTRTTQPPLSADLEQYSNDLYGVELDYPADWTIDSEVGPGILADFGPEDSSDDGPPPFLRLILSYAGEDRTASDAADELITVLAGRPGFRTISETDLPLAAGGTGFQVMYEHGIPPNDSRGSLLTAVRGPQAFVLLLESRRDEYEGNLDLFQEVLESLRMVEPRPFGSSLEDLLVLYMSEPAHLDPGLVHTSLDARYVTQIFDGLVALGTDLDLVPNLATAWDISEDRTVYTFRLDPEASFHDGSVVTAQDVKYSWERATDPALNSPSAEVYLNDIVGANEKLEGTASEISGVRVIDASTLEVTIDAPKTYFLSKLTHPVASVVDQANVEGGSSALGEEWWRSPVGTGPFEVMEWLRNNAMLAARHETYHRGPAQVEEVLFRFYGGTAVSMFEAGEIDVAFVGGQESLEELSAEDNPLSANLQSVADLSVFYLGFDATQPPFDDPKVRRAFLLATDRQRLMDELIGDSGELAHGFLPPGVPGYDPETSPLPYDPQAAHDLLAETEYGSVEGLDTIIYTPGPLGDATAILLLEIWQANLGADIRVGFIPQGQYYDLLSELKGNLYEYGWIADYPHPHNFLDVLFHSSSIDNRGGYNNAEVDGFLEQARVEQDEAVGFDLYRQINQLLVDDVAAIPLYFSRTHFLVQSDVSRFPLSAQGIIELRLITLDR